LDVFLLALLFSKFKETQKLRSLKQYESKSTERSDHEPQKIAMRLLTQACSFQLYFLSIL